MLPQPSTHRDINRLPRRRHVRHRWWVSLRKIVTQSITDTNNILTVKDPANETTSYTYDAANRIKTVTDSRGYSLSYDYDLNGNRTKTTLQPGAADQRIINYSYDNANRLNTLTSPAGIFSFGYNLNSQRTSLSYPNQITASYSYDDAGRLTAITHTKPDTTIITRAGYTLDDVGNRTAKSGSTPESYSYDATYRILQAITPKGYETYSYDQVGNRTTGPGPRDTGYSHDAANRMTQGRQYSYSYDNNGNQTAKSINEIKGWTQSWDYENQLSKSERTKGAEKRTVTYKYDSFGRRIEKKLETTNPTTTETTSYVYDGGNIILELSTDKNGITTKNFYTHGPGIDEPLAMERGSGYYYYHADGLGSITAITDQSRTVVERYSYSVFGQPRPTTGFRNSYQFTGREWDKETGLYRMDYRYYDPMEGRFISKDPSGFDGGINIYAYAWNNPINLTDPSGLRPGDRYRSIDAAGIDAISDINPRSISEDKEYGGWIYMNKDGSYSYTSPYPGSITGTDLGPKPRRVTPVGDYHTHAACRAGYDDENFSPADKVGYSGKYRYGYLGTPRGKIKKYDSRTGRITILR